MNKNTIYGFVFLMIALTLFSCSKQRSNGIKGVNNVSLDECFSNPPVSVRPWAYWVWTNGNFNYSGLKRDLEEIKDKGLGGFDIFDIGERYAETGTVPAGPSFLGKESLEAIHFAMKEASRLGLELGLIVSSSWNAGGSWISNEYANMALFPSEKVIVKGPGRFSERLPFPSFPVATAKDPDGMPAFYKDIAVIAFPNTGDSIIKSVSSIMDITDRMDNSGNLEWDIPEGEWIIVRFICTNTGKTLHAPSINSNGLVIDHFNPDATEFHFQTVINKLLSETGSLENTALKYLYLCSYEVWGISWTPNLQQEFLKRRGYNINQYLPAFLGMTIQDEEVTKRFNYDFQKTICDLIVDAHYKNARDISNKYGVQLCSESGGPGPVPVEALKALGALDIPRGEFWYKSPTFLVKEIACAAHIYGKKIVDQEAFTSWLMWQEGPCDLKSVADRAFCSGMNKVTFHTYAHTPPESGKPGWVYWAGTHIGPCRVWWPKAKPFMDYLSRCCFLLREGLFVGDVCYYYGDQGFNYVPEKHIDPSLGYGYDYDVTNSEVILTRMEAKDGKICLPDGMKYELLVLPDREDIDLDVLKKIQELVKAGITVVGPKPLKTNGLKDYPNSDEEVFNLANEIWGQCDGKIVKRNNYGKGEIIWGITLREVLYGKGIIPDFSFTGNVPDTNLDFIHRQTEKEDVYFIVNKSKFWVTGNCTFRVKDKVPELWDPTSGKISKNPVFTSKNESIMVLISLPPEGSIFTIFRENPNQNHIVSLKKDNQQIFPIITEKNENRQIIDILYSENNVPEFLLWQPGTYVFEKLKGNSEKIIIENMPEEIDLSENWEIRFPEGWGAPTSKFLPKLHSWTEDSNEGIKYFSGIAIYYKEFELSEDFIKQNNHIIIDLGEIELLADVYLNGNHIGILWDSPYRSEITDALKPGKNNLIVEVANTWSNRLVGDANLPAKLRRTYTNIKQVGGPYKKGPEWKDVPLLESGLIGPVKLIPINKVTINL